MELSWEEQFEQDVANDVRKFIQVYGYPNNKKYTANDLSKLYDLFPMALCEGGYRVQAHFKQMKYTDFLKTPYWKIISATMKDRSPKCHLCGNTKNLVVHHLTYSNHGLEIDFLENLIVVCKECHEEHFHRDLV